MNIFNHVCGCSVPRLELPVRTLPFARFRSPAIDVSYTLPMARRDPLATRIAALEAQAKTDIPPPLSDLVTALEHKSSLVVAAAGKVVKSHRLETLIPRVISALDQFYTAEDPQCRAKLSLLQALCDMDQTTVDICQRAVRHVQMEAVWGGRQDSAGPLRILGLGGLVALGSQEIYALIADLLADPLAEVRGAAARVAGQVGGERPALLLRLRLHLGDAAEPANLGDYAAGYLACAGDGGVPLVAGFLERADRLTTGPLVLALGESRLATALPVLTELLERRWGLVPDGDLLTAIALHRSEGAARCLLEILDGEDRTRARRAALELRLYRERSEVVEEVRRILQRWPELREILADFFEQNPASAT